MIAKSGDKQRECKPNDNKRKSETKVCERIKNTIKENKRNLRGWDG